MAFRHIDWCSSTGEYLDDACTCPCKCDTDDDFEHCPKHPACCMTTCEDCGQYVVYQEMSAHKFYYHSAGVKATTAVGSWTNYFTMGTQYDEV